MQSISKFIGKGRVARTPAGARSFAGAATVKLMDPSVNDFDVCIVGGHNATALAKFMQHEGHPWKIALISEQQRFICPENYFVCGYGMAPELKIESGTVSSQVKASARLNAGDTVVKYLPEQNKIVLSNGREYTYKTLIVAAGLEHKTDFIEGLREIDEDEKELNVYAHLLDAKERLNRNFFHGWSNTNGDFIMYSPKMPYKGEGSDFYGFYYEHLNR